MLRRLHLTHFRNYKDQVFLPASRLSVVCGINGSGKTSLLESIYVLATGRSFRTSKLGNLVESSSEACTLFAELGIEKDAENIHRVGLSRNKQSLIDARIDGQKISGLSQIARLMPVQVLHPGTVQLIEGGPGDRRRYLDWLMFHVEPEFSGVWQRLREAVSQRNKLLKLGAIKERELGVWDQQVADNSARIDRLRRAHLPALEAAFTALLAGFDSSLGKVSLALHSGWAEGSSIEEALASHREQDVRRGFTSVGAHRADLALKSRRGQVKEVFSRGQQKVVAYALVTAQIEMLNTLASRRCLVLVDDITSELDQGNEAKVLDSVLSTGNQVVVTTLDERIAIPYATDETTKLFHVEHGVLRPS
jgi:DNA replication and repair protein RecF